MRKSKLLVPKDVLKQLSRVSNILGIAKSSLYLLAIAVLSGMIVVLDTSLPTLVLLQLLLGVVFAHGLELQHEALHNNLFTSKHANKIFGILFGIPMAVSFTHYRLQHLYHHRFVGTNKNNEIFNYNAHSLANPFSFLLRAINISRIPFFIYQFVEFLQGNYDEIFKSKACRRNVLFEYSLILLLVTIALFTSFHFHTSAWVLCWFIPWLVFAELAHFLIELPEHIGCDQGSPDILLNTRTYPTNFMLEYIFNSNNYHVEHHLYPSVTASNLRKVHNYIKSDAKFVERSYIEAIKCSLGHQFRDHIGEHKGRQYD